MQPDILYLSHGGGPMPLLGDPSHQEMVDTLQSISAKLTKPKAIIVFSAHWEERKPTITAGANPSLIYDYYGFPAQAYDLTYPCAGAPELAKSVQSALSQAGIESTLSEERGYDHGVFVPLLLMYPEADIPVIQISLMQHLDAQAHIQLGRALTAVDLSDVLVIGSGFSFHNMRAFFSQDASANTQNLAFDQWLQTTLTSPALSEAEREQHLIEWHLAPGGRFSHPREEHLIPLHICYGLAARVPDETFALKIVNKHASMFLWAKNGV